MAGGGITGDIVNNARGEGGKVVEQMGAVVFGVCAVCV